MLAMMQLHRLGIDHRGERIRSIWQGRQFIGHVLSKCLPFSKKRAVGLCSRLLLASGVLAWVT